MTTFLPVQIVFSRTPLSEDQQQWIMYQCLAGLNYMHMAGVVHRDLKPSNILVDTDTCDVRLCDFGLSRGVLKQSAHDVLPNSGLDDQGEAVEGAQAGEGKEEMTVYVVTRWYRAPEVMLEYHEYGTEIDMWSMGCILGELLGRKPLLQGRNTMDQLKLTVKLLGKPDPSDLWYVTNKNALNFMLNMPDNPPVDLGAKLSDATSTSVDLVQRMLAMDPNKRISCSEAIAHTWLEPVREVDWHEQPPGFTVVMSDIESMTLTKPNLQSKIYEEIHQFHQNQSGASSYNSGQVPSGPDFSHAGAAEQTS